MGKYKSKIQQWAEGLVEGDWVIDETHDLAQVLLSIPKTYQHIDFLCETKARETFWTTNEKIKPPHRIRWVGKPKVVQKKKAPRPAGRKRLHVKVNDPIYGIYLYMVDELLPSDVVEYPCVKIYISEGHVSLDFMRHVFAKPITVTHPCIDRDDALYLAAAHAAHVYKTRY